MRTRDKGQGRKDKGRKDKGRNMSALLTGNAVNVA